MKLYTPPEVGLVADYAGHDNYDSKPEGWVAHYPGIDRDYTGELSDTFKALRGIERYAMSKDWWGIAYDYWVDLGGHIGIGRGTARSGATSGDYDEDGIPNNNETDAILFVIGNNQDVTKEMLIATQVLIDELGGLRKYFVGHREAGSITTACPGIAVMKKIVVPLQQGKKLNEVDAPVKPTPIKPKRPQPGDKTDWRDKLYEEMEQVDLRLVEHQASRLWPRGRKVRILQGLLVANDVAPSNTIKDDGSLDGIGGPGTKKALGRFQKKVSLIGDFVAGPLTYRAALRGLKEINAAGVTTSNQTWIRGKHVEVLQALLVANGVAPDDTITQDGDLDGVCGPGTKKAIRKFQDRKGLKVDGVVGRNTYRALTT